MHICRSGTLQGSPDVKNYGTEQHTEPTLLVVAQGHKWRGLIQDSHFVYVEGVRP